MARGPVVVPPRPPGLPFPAVRESVVREPVQGGARMTHIHSGRDLSGDVDVNPLFARPGELRTRPGTRLADLPMLPETAYQMVHDEAMLDGNARLNLATFVGTWMDDQAAQAVPRSRRQEHDRQGRVPADRGDRGRGAGGSSPTCGMRRTPSERSAARPSAPPRPACSAAWRSSGAGSRRAARPASPTGQPNLVMSRPCRSCWEKFCNYWDVEPRYVPDRTEEHKMPRRHDLEEYVDENTIGVVAIMGVTYTGMYEPVRGDQPRPWTRSRPRPAWTSRSTSTAHPAR